MEEAIQNLYETFAPYRIGNDFTGCDCCVGAEHSASLAKPPLRDLTYDDLVPINRNIRIIIENVVQGRRGSAKTLVDLMTPQPKTKSLLTKLFGGGK